jgi:subtilisin family serine protease
LRRQRRRSRDRRVLLAEPDYRISLRRTPNDPLYNAQWAMNNTGIAGRADADLDLPEGWEATIGGPRTVVAVIDTGIDLRHRDLVSNLWRNSGEKPGNGKDDDGNGYADDVHGYDFSNRDGDPTDDNGHGTHVAGIIGAVGANGIGITGVNWRAADGVEVPRRQRRWSLADAIEALNYAVAMGARISNNSWGGAGRVSCCARRCRARDQGTSSSPRPATRAPTSTRSGLPAALDLDNVITVAATDRSDQLARSPTTVRSPSTWEPRRLNHEYSSGQHLRDDERNLDGRSFCNRRAVPCLGAEPDVDVPPRHRSGAAHG